MSLRDDVEDGFHQVEEINAAQHHQHLVHVVRHLRLVAVAAVAASAGFVRVDVQAQKLRAVGNERQCNISNEKPSGSILFFGDILDRGCAKSHEAELVTAHHGQQVQQSVPRERTHGQADAELDAQLEDAGARRAQQQHDAEHGHERDDHVGQSCVQVSWVTCTRGRQGQTVNNLLEGQ